MDTDKQSFDRITIDMNDVDATLALYQLSDMKAMNIYMNRVALETFSFFDTARHPSAYTEPERFHSAKAITMSLTEPNSSACFYHGFVLGLLVEMRNRYVITSNRESGFGRYDVMLEPKCEGDPAYLLEFKVQDPQDEDTLKDTVSAALSQIEKKGYEAALLAKGIPRDSIKKYGFAFEGKKILIG